MNATQGTLLGSLAWAAAMLVSAYVFKGHPAGDWIDSVVFFGFIFWLSSRSACLGGAAGKC